MLIGFDASRISVANRTGTENYSYQLLKHILELESTHAYRLYLRGNLDDPILKHSRVDQKVIGLPRLWTQLGLATEVMLRRPDLLFIPAHTLPVIRPRNMPTVVTIHDLGAEYLPQYHQFPSKLYLNKSTEYAISQASHLIAVSEFTRQDIINKYQVDPDRVTAIPLGVDLEANRRASSTEIEKVRQKHHLNQNYVLFVGTIQPRKNLTRLIEAYAKILPTDYDLVLAGGKGWLSDEIYNSPARRGISERVKFLGYIDELDKPALYSGATATALVSLFEGFGLPAIESMACGTPVLASNASSIPEVVGKAAVLVDPNDVDSIAAGLSRLLYDQSLRQDLSVKGLKQAAKFSWQHTASQTLAVFEKFGNKT